MERLQKVIAEAGVASRRKAEQLILDGRVKVDGVVCNVLGTKVKGDAVVEVDGVKIKKEEKIYFVMNKPKNVLCSVQDDRERQTCVDLIETDYRIFPVGRLDFDTTGLLILTNDGNFTNELIHPRYHIGKTYEVTIEGVLEPAQVKEMEKGLELEDGMTLPCKVKVNNRNVNKNQTQFDIVIYEGRNRQIKRMVEYFGYSVKRLHRKQLGTLTIADLKPGEYRRLKPFEIVTLRSLANSGKRARK